MEVIQDELQKNNVRIDIETLTEHIEYILNNYRDSYSHAIDLLTREELLLDVFHEMDVNSLGRAMAYLTLVYRTSHMIKEDTVRQAVRLVAPVIRNTGRVEGVIYCYGEYQKEFDELRGVDFIEGFPQDLNELTQGHDQTLLVLDDLMSECSKDQRVSDLFTRGSHHKGISVLYLTQNLFPPGKLSRTISLNSHYFIIFKNPRDSLGIATLAKQMFPNRTQYLMDSFHDATKKPFSYLLIDCHPQTPENIRLRTNIFPGERHIVYIPK